jgi:TRAP-type uncharacterized transport system substrate-binding protein
MAARMEDRSKSRLAPVLAPFTELFGMSRAAAFVVFLIVVGAVLFAVFWFFHSAPPKKITIISGFAGSTFETNAVRYKGILASNGVTLRILHSKGSVENLERLKDPKFPVDIGFVQSGITNTNAGRRLISLGSISYQALIIFYRAQTNVTLLSEFKGKRLAIGPVGSGTHSLAAPLLAMNGIDASGTNFVDLEADAAAKALIDGNIDAVFLMGDSASPQLMRKLFQTPGVQVYSFTQADAYTRRFSYLNKLDLPRGAIDFGKDIPSRDVMLVAPSVELVARADLHPALIDLVIEAAQDVHGSAGIFKRKNEFPSPQEHDFPVSAEATRYYKSGKSGLYRYLPFWLASLVNRVLVVFVPLLVVLIPGLRMIPTLLRLRVRLQLYRWYRALLAIDRELRLVEANANRETLLRQLDEIERGANDMKVPASFADQFYGLRTHIGLVRAQLEEFDGR